MEQYYHQALNLNASMPLHMRAFLDFVAPHFLSAYDHLTRKNKDKVTRLTTDQVLGFSIIITKIFKDLYIHDDLHKNNEKGEGEKFCLSPKKRKK